MTKAKTNLIKLKTDNSSYFYTFNKSKQMDKEKKKKLKLKKYDPISRKHLIFKETKLK
jgi:large subunit ribosomal protein L33